MGENAGMTYTIITKEAVEFGSTVTLYSAICSDGYQTVFFASVAKAIAAAERHRDKASANA
jgi:hypothetical protein